MDRKIDITQRGRLAFNTAIDMIWLDEYNDKGDRPRTSNAYYIKDNKFYICQNSTKPESIKLPYLFTRDQIKDLIWGWLQATEPTEAQYNGDGDSEKGFTVTTEGTDYQSPWDYSTFAVIKPTWIYYGK